MVNSLIISYQTGQTSLADVYLTVTREVGWDRCIRMNSVGVTCDEHEVADIYNDALMKAVDTYDEAKGDFVPFLNGIIRNRLRDLARRNKRRYNKVVPVSSYDDPDTDSSVLERQVDYTANVEDIVMKKERSITLSRVAEETSSLASSIVSLYPHSTSLNNVAKKLGLHHSKVFYEVGKLRKNLLKCSGENYFSEFNRVTA